MEKIFATIIKDEHPYLEEWIEYHLSLGFDKCILCEDDGSKSHKEITDKFNDKVEYMAVTFNNVGNHHIAFYNKLLKRYKGTDTYIAAIDVEEYIELVDVTLDELLSYHTKDKSIQLWWQLMTANGHIEKQSKVRESYTEPWEDQFKHPREIYCKFIWNCNFLEELGRHVHAVKEGASPLGECEYINNDNRELVTKEHFKHAYIKHYYTKSLEDWKEKCIKGMAQFSKMVNYARLKIFFLINQDLKEYEEDFLKWYWDKMAEIHKIRRVKTERV